MGGWKNDEEAFLLVNSVVVLYIKVEISSLSWLCAVKVTTRVLVYI